MWLDRQHSRWTAPAFAVGLGVLIWCAAIVGGQPSVGLMFLVVMTLTGLALTVAIIAAFTYELAAGRDGLQYAWLGAVGGLTYLASIIVLRLRA